MSKNELVSYIHALTGKSYKDARAICKAAKWNPNTAIIDAIKGNHPIYKALENAKEFFGKVAETVREFVMSAPDILAADEDDAQTLEPWTAETSADILNGNEIKQLFIDEINDGGEI